MAFAKRLAGPLAQAGMFGLPGLALSGAFKKDKKKDKEIPPTSFVTEGAGRTSDPSLLNDTRY